jgi:hypothetical protein
LTPLLVADGKGLLSLLLLPLRVLAPAAVLVACSPADIDLLACCLPEALGFLLCNLLQLS